MPYKNRETQMKAQADWSKKNTKGIYLKLCKGADADIISWLSECSNKQGYIKELIRADLRKDEYIKLREAIRRMKRPSQFSHDDQIYNKAIEDVLAFIIAENSND